MTPSDDELMGQVRGGDPEAFATLVDRYKDAVVGYLCRLSGSRDRAEEMAQETFVRLYEHRVRYREGGTLAGYLFRIATNLLRTEERRRRRWRFLEPLLPAATAVPAPSHQALAREEQRQVSRALAELDLSLRSALVLREIEGLTYGEIASVLGCREGTVKSRLHRGREALRARLAPYWRGAAGRPEPVAAGLEVSP